MGHRRGALGSGHWDHISISSRGAPRSLGRKGGWQGKAAARSRAPSRFHGCLGSLDLFSGAGSRPGRSAAGRRLTFPFPRKGLPRGLRAAQRGRVTLIRDVKGDFGNPLLPPAPSAASLRRRLQVEKSPVGRTAAEASKAAPCLRNSSRREPSPPRALAPWNAGTQLRRGSISGPAGGGSLAPALASPWTLTFRD